MKKIWSIPLLTLLIPFISCNSSAEEQHTQNQSIIRNEATQQFPVFQEKNAYEHIAKQVSFGPRVPGTEAHLNCANWLETQLKIFMDTVYRQETTLTAGNGIQLPCINLIGSINPNAQKRVLLLAHWDTRPWADQEDRNSTTAIDGADDGASGVGVLIELARVLNENPLPNQEYGIDILFTDVEDYGKTEWGDDSYAMGTQYWARNPHVPNYKAEFGILLDMVGGRNPRFVLEGFSQQYANHILQGVWRAAGQAGFSSYFLYENGPAITDDHVPVNQIAKIPTINIINLPAGSRTGFVPHWHTQQDNMDVIDPRTLKAVGQTLIQYLYQL